MNDRVWRICVWAAMLFCFGCILGALLGGCAWLGMRGEVLTVPNAEQAQWVIWHDVYQRNDLPPRVRWVTEFDCTQHPSGDPGFSTVVGCRDGFTFSPLEISVALHPDRRLDESQLAHEDMHALLARQGAFDPDHSLPQFHALETCGECAFQPGARLKDCRQDDALGIDCTTVQRNPCGDCGLVEWANEQLQRRGE